MFLLYSILFLFNECNISNTPYDINLFGFWGTFFSFFFASFNFLYFYYTYYFPFCFMFHLEVYQISGNSCPSDFGLGHTICFAQWNVNEHHHPCRSFKCLWFGAVSSPELLPSAIWENSMLHIAATHYRAWHQQTYELSGVQGSWQYVCGWSAVLRITCKQEIPVASHWYLWSHLWVKMYTYTYVYIEYFWKDSLDNKSNKSRGVRERNS